MPINETTFRSPMPHSSARSRGWLLGAGLAAVVGCAAACSLPLLGLLLGGGGVAAALARVLGGPGEVIAGAAAAGIALAWMAVRRRRARGAATCSTSDRPGACSGAC